MVVNDYGHYAFLLSYSMAKYAQIENGEEKVYVPEDTVQSSLMLSMSCMVMRKSFPYVKQFNQM